MFANFKFLVPKSEPGNKKWRSTYLSTTSCRRITASAGRLSSCYHSIDYRTGAAYPCIYCNCRICAVSGACAALHTTVFIAYCSLAAVHSKDRVRAYLNAPSATGAFIGEKFKARYIGEIFHRIPHSFNLKITSKTREIKAPDIYTGMANRSSFLTPDIPVNTVAPVNCRAIYELANGKNKNEKA